MWSFFELGEISNIYKKEGFSWFTDDSIFPTSKDEQFTLYLVKEGDENDNKSCSPLKQIAISIDNIFEDEEKNALFIGENEDVLNISFDFVCSPEWYAFPPCSGEEYERIEKEKNKLNEKYNKVDL